MNKENQDHNWQDIRWHEANALFNTSIKTCSAEEEEIYRLFNLVRIVSNKLADFCFNKSAF